MNLVLLPNWKGRPVKITGGKLTPEQILQRRMFNQKRLIHAMRQTNPSIRDMQAAEIKLAIITSEILRK